MKLGAMIDCSRGGVYTVAALKKYIDKLKEMGYDYLQLYTEDVYEIKDEPHFGYLRGKYSCAELKELDKYALSQGIELVPCIQTLAHLRGVTRWWYYEDISDTLDIMLCGNERTYELIDKMFAACAECFTSRRIHIGMDEAGMVGLGKYLAQNGYKNTTEILSAHLRRVCELAQKYGFTPMMWSDMFLRAVNDGNYYVGKDFCVPQDVIKAVPPEAELVYWDYYTKVKDKYDAQFAAHKQFNNKIIFACGAWCWTGFVPHNEWSNKINRVAFESAIEHGVDEILVTCWKDNGSESSLFSNLPSLYAAAQYARGNYDMPSIKDGFGKLFGIKYDDFIALDEADYIDIIEEKNPTKYSLYSDPFLGYLDCLVNEDQIEKFTLAEKKIVRSIADPEYGYIFDTVQKLCAVIELKYDLGVRTRRAYKSGDKVKVKALCADYAELINRVQALYNAFKTQWDKECKFNGFEHHDIRFGGLILRLQHCMEILKDYASGKIREIPALDEEILPLSDKIENGVSIRYNDWFSTAFIKPEL